MRIAAYGQADLGGYFGGMTAGIAVRRWCRNDAVSLAS
jgi:hypothetical protein